VSDDDVASHAPHLQTDQPPHPDFKEEYVAQGERERQAAERGGRYSQPPFKQQYFNAPAQRGHQPNTNSETESETATESDSDNEKDNTARGPRNFTVTDSHISNSSNGKREGTQSKPVAPPSSKRERQRASPVFTQNSSAYAKRPKDKQRHWVDDASPRVSRVGSTTDSLVAENGESYTGFIPENAVPAGIPGSYPVGGTSKPVGNKRANSMPSDSGASTATTRVL